MFNPKYRFTHDEVRIIVLALVELKNQLLAEGRYPKPPGSSKSFYLDLKHKRPQEIPLFLLSRHPSSFS